MRVVVVQNHAGWNGSEIESLHVPVLQDHVSPILSSCVCVLIILVVSFNYRQNMDSQEVCEGLPLIGAQGSCGGTDNDVAGGWWVVMRRVSIL